MGKQLARIQEHERANAHRVLVVLKAHRVRHLRRLVTIDVHTTEDGQVEQVEAGLRDSRWPVRVAQ